ncbi:hypothetical protein FQN51_002977 [Onygenales sp. PD_10]|nr:hypothetical protein FQN51_002977 [Onygenales sp. PD_10]
MGQEFSISQHRQSLPAPGVPLQISPGDRKRPLPALQLENKAPRPIQPKPPIPGQYPIQESRTPVQLSPGVDANFFGEPPRKRGRPSKAEMQRRSLAAQARGEPYPPPKKAPPRPQVDLSPIGPSLESSTLPAIRPQVSGSPVHGLSMQQPDAAGSQTHDIQVHRAPRPQIPASPPIPPSAEPRESTPRTILENQVPPPPTSSAPSFRGVNQTSSVPASPRPETPLISSSAAVENGREPTQAFSGSAKGATS